MPKTKAEASGELALRPEDPLQRLKGIGPRLSSGLEECGICSLFDLLLHVPRHYEDRTRVTSLVEIDDVRDSVLVRCRVLNPRIHYSRGRGKVIGGELEDATGRLPVVWFNRRWKDPRLEDGAELFLYGSVQRLRGGALKLVNPEIEFAEESPGKRFVPVYRPIGPLSARRVRDMVAAALPALDRLDEPLDDTERARFGVSSVAEALRGLHTPDLDPAADSFSADVMALNEKRSPHHRCLMLYEAMALFCEVAAHSSRRRRLRAPRCTVDGALRARAAKLLPFRLTGAQRRVTAEIVADMGRVHPMARLLQGDVGSGKTAVAALAMLVCSANGHQAAMMAPTELLAEQHHRSLRRMMARVGEDVGLLTSSQPAGERRAVGRALADGSLRLVVGTHALFQKSLSFADLGLAVIDEQHRFGVRDRRSLVAKGSAPHLLVMTATPIPRSLALTVYGDLELSVIDELPPGRLPVRTVLRPSSARPKVLEFIRKEAGRGGRAFVVCPIIESSESLDVTALEDTFEEVTRALSDCAVGILHGRMTRTERELVQRAFRTGELQVLVATSVVEVGVDVPEATVMVVESPERFGLAQLHQLRGRVGRGERRSYCVLFASEELGDQASARLQSFCECHDGFEIAESDLRLRGPGEISGERQWGIQGTRFIDLLGHHRLLEHARAAVEQVVDQGGLTELSRRLRVFQFRSNGPAHI